MICLNPVVVVIVVIHRFRPIQKQRTPDIQGISQIDSVIIIIIININELIEEPLSTWVWSSSFLVPLSSIFCGPFSTTDASLLPTRRWSGATDEANNCCTILNSFCSNKYRLRSIVRLHASRPSSKHLSQCSYVEFVWALTAFGYLRGIDYEWHVRYVHCGSHSSLCLNGGK